MLAQEHLTHWAGHSPTSILLFHRVTDDIPEDGLTVSTAYFRDFCKLMQRSFHVVPLAEIYGYLERDETPPRRTVAITFDDCYYDNLAAARVLSEHGLPATFYVPTKYVGTDHLFTWDQGLTRMKNLTWDDVREMKRLGHDIGSHTVTHADLGKATPEEAHWELTESKQTLERELQAPADWFAYPFGQRSNFKPEYFPLALQAGYKGVVSGFGGFVTPQMKGQILPRDAVPCFRSLLNLELHLTGCLRWIYSMKRKVGLVAT